MKKKNLIDQNKKMGGKEMTILHTGEVGNVGHAWTTF